MNITVNSGIRYRRSKLKTKHFISYKPKWALMEHQNLDAWFQLVDNVNVVVYVNYTYLIKHSVRNYSVCIVKTRMPAIQNHIPTLNNFD